jgi:small GTP-binding protein
VPHSTPTVGMEFGTALINVGTLGEKKVKLHIWDTAGQELFFSLTRSYYVGAHAALLLFDVTNSLSFDHLPTWIKEVKNNCGNPNLLCILVGSKTDCVHLRKVSQAKAQAFATKEGLMYIETSSKGNINVSEAFLQPAKLVWEMIQSKIYTEENPCWPGTGGSRSAVQVLDLNAPPIRSEEAKCCS